MIDPYHNILIFVDSDSILGDMERAIFLEEAAKGVGYFLKQGKGIDCQLKLWQILNKGILYLLDEQKEFSLLIVEDDDFGSFGDRID